MAVIQTLLRAFRARPLAFWDVSKDWYQACHVETAVAIVAKQQLFAAFISNACATAAVELVQTLVFRGFGGLSALLGDRGERNIGDCGVGLDDVVLDEIYVGLHGLVGGLSHGVWVQDGGGGEDGVLLQ